MVVKDWHPLDRDNPPPPEPDNSDVTNDDLLAILGGEILPSDIKRRRIMEAGRIAREARLKEAYADLPTYIDKHYPNTRELRDLHRKGIAGGQAWMFDLGDVSYCGKIEDAVRQVLATREHVPNKKEASVIRRKKAKAGGRAHHGKN